MPYCATELLKYENIKTLITQKNVWKSLLSEIKAHFKDDISSPRRYESIKTIKDLVDCLESIGIISAYDIDRLSEITQYFADDELDMALEKYVKPSDQKDMNIYALQRAGETNNIKSVPFNDVKCVPNNFNQNHIVEQKPITVMVLTDRKRNDIYKVVSQEIGRNWRFFGRELGVRSGALDKIEFKHPNDLQSRVFEVFEIFENDPKSNPRDHLNIICEALDKCRRKDLRRDVQKIMSF